MHLLLNKRLWWHFYLYFLFYVTYYNFIFKRYIKSYNIQYLHFPSVFREFIRTYSINICLNNDSEVICTYMCWTFDLSPCILPTIVPVLLFFTQPPIPSCRHRSLQYLVKYTPVEQENGNRSVGWANNSLLWGTPFRGVRNQ